MNTIIITGDAATLFINARPYIVPSDHLNYTKIIELARSGHWNEIPALVDIVTTLNNSIVETGNSDMKIKDNRVVYKHITLPDDLSAYLINMIRDGFSLDPMINFLEKLLKNPDHRVFQQLFGFLTYGKNPLTPEGNFLAYKKVRVDYTSVHDGITKNDIGSIVEMSRTGCNSNPEETCSSGLHFCSREYLSNFSGAKIVVLEIDPADVVSIPVDYNNTKGRACKYKVIGELDENEKMIVEKKEDVIKTATVETKYSNNAEASYNRGYKAGRNKKAKAEPNNVDYVEGHTDGRKKLPNKYSSETPSVQQTYINDYLAGYKAGRSKKAKTDAGNTAYEDGYKDGRNKKQSRFVGA